MASQAKASSVGWMKHSAKRFHEYVYSHSMCGDPCGGKSASTDVFSNAMIADIDMLESGGLG